MLISSLYHRAPAKKDVGVRRINKERMRVKIQRACFVDRVRLVKAAK